MAPLGVFVRLTNCVYTVDQLNLNVLAHTYINNILFSRIHDMRSGREINILEGHKVS